MGILKRLVGISDMGVDFKLESRAVSAVILQLSKEDDIDVQLKIGYGGYKSKRWTTGPGLLCKAD